MYIIDQYLNKLNNIRSISLMFIPHKDKIYVGLNKKNNLYEIPGGEIQKNEEPKDAAIRETLEEIGVLVSNVKELVSPISFKEKQGTLKIYSYIGTFLKYDNSKWGNGPEGKLERSLININDMIDNENERLKNTRQIGRCQHIIKILKSL